MAKIDEVRDMTDELFIGGVNEPDEYEKCWENGDYDDQYCPECPYYEMCSGGDSDDD